MTAESSFEGSSFLASAINFLESSSKSSAFNVPSCASPAKNSRYDFLYAVVDCAIASANVFNSSAIFFPSAVPRNSSLSCSSVSFFRLAAACALSASSLICSFTHASSFPASPNLLELSIYAPNAFS